MEEYPGSPCGAASPGPRPIPARAPWWLWVAALGLWLAAFYPLWEWLVATWLGSPYYSHGFLVPLVSLLLAWRLERGRPAAAEQGLGNKDVFGGLLLAGLGLGGGWGAIRRGLWPWAGVALIGTLAGIVWALAGRATLRRQAFPLAFTLLMVPLPWPEAITPPLARAVAGAAAGLARGLGIPATAQGAQVQLGGIALAVGAPCSGVNSLAALVTLAVLYAFLVRGPWWGRLGLVAAAAPIALLANLVRVTAMVLLAHGAGVAVALKYFHTWSSPLLFLLALGLLVLVGRGWRCSGIRSDL